MQLFNEKLLRSKTVASELTPSEINTLLTWHFAKGAGIADGLVIDKVGGQTRDIQPGRCYEFDGIDDQVTTPYTPSSNEVWVSYYFKLSASTVSANGIQFGFFSGLGDSYNIYYWGANSNKYFGFNTWNSDSFGINGVGIIDNTDWHHIVAKFNFGDHSQGQLWINGVEHGLSQQLGPTLNKTLGAQTFNIAKQPNNNHDQKFGGKMSDVVIYEGSLSANQIDELTQNGFINDLTPNAMYKMDEALNAISFDASGNAHHGTIENATLSTFHAVDSGVNKSWQNNVGYTNENGVLIPRNESNTSEDIQGNPLQYSGRVKYNLELVESHSWRNDNSNDYVRVSSVMTAAEISDYPFEIEALVKIRGAVSGYEFIFDTSEFALSIGAGEVVCASTGSSSAFVNSTESITIDKWHKVKAVYNSASEVQIFIDDQLDSTHSISAGTIADSNVQYIGAEKGSARYFNGSIAYTKVSNASGVIGHWVMSPGIGESFYDVSGNGKHGRGQNIPLTTQWTDPQDVFHWNLEKGYGLRSRFVNVANSKVTIPLTGTRSNATVRMKIQTFSSTGILFHTSTNGTYIGAWISGGTPADANVGSPIYTINGVQQTAPISRGVLRNHVRYGQVLDIEITNLDLTNWPDMIVAHHLTSATYRPNAVIWDIELDLNSDGTIDHRYTGYGENDWDDKIGNNDATIFALKDIRVPAADTPDHNLAADGGPVTHPAGYYHNGAETKVRFPVAAPALKQADNSLSVPFWFTGDTPNTKSYGDIVNNPNGDQNLYIGQTNQGKENLLGFEESLNGGDHNNMLGFIS